MMPALKPTDAERLERLEKQVAQLRSVVELHRKIPRKHSDPDNLIIQVSLILIAAFTGILLYRAIARNEYPSVPELGAIGVSILLLRTDKVTAADISAAALRRALGVPEKD
jgi:hypothetical protein